MGLGVPFLGISITYLLTKLMSVTRDFIFQITDPSRHCHLLNNVTFSSRAYSQTIEIHENASGNIISWDSLPYSDFLAWHNYCENFKKIISSIWIIIILCLVIYLLYRSGILDFLKAAIIAPAIYVTLLDDLFFPVGIILMIGLLVFFIRTKKPWYFYYSLVIFFIISLFILLLRSLG